MFSDLLLTGKPVNVLFGPACDYALAAVARFSKFHSLPLVTAGGFAMDFSEPKDKRFDEFYMLTRTGMAWTGLVEMFHKFMRQEQWSKYTLVYRSLRKQNKKDLELGFLGVSTIGSGAGTIRVTSSPQPCLTRRSRRPSLCGK